MTVSMPIYHTLKNNIVKILRDFSNSQEKSLQFEVVRDRYRTWIENQQNKPLVNVIVTQLEPSGGGKFHHDYTATVNVDMFVLGKGKKEIDEQTGGFVLFPADEKAADRLDLLVAQVQFAITQLAKYDFGFPAGAIGRITNAPSLTLYSQSDDTTGNFAPARFTFSVTLPYAPVDNCDEYLNEEYFIKLKEKSGETLEISIKQGEK